MKIGTKNNSPKFEVRPWGTYTVLDEGKNFKVKRIEVLPEKRLSYQKHAFRSEHWLIIAGTARVTLNDKTFDLEAGASVDIDVGNKHRVENPKARTRLVFIEIQRGNYLGEDDIVRFEDDFGRTENE